MIIRKTYLRWPYQRVSTNRFIVDSPRFWRPEFHPRFNDIFTIEDFIEVLSEANSDNSFPIMEEFIELVGNELYSWFSDYRFICIPTKMPNSPAMFLSDLYFTLLDVLPQMSFSNFPLIQDDFNLVTHRAETGKNDTTKLGTSEHNKQYAKHETELDILSQSELRQNNEVNTENIDERTDQNTKQVDDYFMSAQNQGVKPTIENTVTKGVDGITLNPNPSFTTNTRNANTGDTTVNKTNTTFQKQNSDQALIQNNDSKTLHEINNELGMGQEQENTTAKNDNYIETLDFDRPSRLQEFYDLMNADSLFAIILARMSKWILQVDIATGERNYNDCQLYK